MQRWTTEEIKRNIHKVQFEHGEPATMLLISDVHFDSKKCDRKLLTKHFEEIRNRNGYVIVNGDWFDLMQGKYDPRGSKYDIRPEYNKGDYIDSVIRDSAQWLAQWGVPIFFGQGNHETNILRRLETNVLERLCEQLRSLGTMAYVGGYSGWLIIQSKRIGNSSKPKTMQTVVHYHHGSGGNAQRSKGILKADINQMQNPDADIIIRGHDHNKWYLPVTVQRLNGRYNEEKQSTVHHLQTGSYKLQGDRFAGWETEKGFPVTRMGGWFLNITDTYDANRVDYHKLSIFEAD